jgi:hypothetical protein
VLVTGLAFVSVSIDVHRDKRGITGLEATLVERDGHCATVRLTLGRLGRWLGARETMVELHVQHVTDIYGPPHPERHGDRSFRWRFAATGRDVKGARHGELILRALEQVPVAAPARAIALRRHHPRRSAHREQ